ncbi:hypothetical protein WJU23_10900 [Prosthecobacter sp. SYSU 5D2]|uniref:peptidoglycan-binding domain-containing protein n=1 Tax=Prosthecobacter sp. SYSU 5D2 TaxID=3134134 RepID=UPI0031FECDB5
MSTITTSVGKGGMNSKTEDNRLVQQLLNSRIGSIIGSLVVDGIVGQKTIAAIEYFQQFKMGLSRPDGRVDVGGKTIKALTQNGPPPPSDQVALPPPTNQSGAFSTAQQIAALKEAAKLYDIAVSPGNMCGKYTFNLAYNYIKSLRSQPLHPITSYSSMLAAGGNAKQQSYHNNLKLLGYSETVVAADCSKTKLKELIATTQFNIGDVIVYWGLHDDGGVTSSGAAVDGHWKYGHTQLFTDKKILPSYDWASDPKNNYGASFVYNNATKYPGNNWALKVLRAPAA